MSLTQQQRAGWAQYETQFPACVQCLDKIWRIDGVKVVNSSKDAPVVLVRAHCLSCNHDQVWNPETGRTA